MEGTYCRALAGTTMHLIINSLDTRRWMSDGGFAGGWWPGKGCKAGGLVCCKGEGGREGGWRIEEGRGGGRRGEWWSGGKWVGRMRERGSAWGR